MDPYYVQSLLQSKLIELPCSNIFCNTPKSRKIQLLATKIMPDYRLQHETESEFVEADPTGRYGRYNEVLGKGSSKTVYRAFDEIDGIEVAWYQVKVKDVLQTPEDLERLYSEVHLLKTLNHKNIIKFYSSWVDTQNSNINFITEMFTSGTLRQYRQKHKRVDITAVKNWSRQILRGLLYLHSHDPPIIHRDLKCDNIFVNGNQGEVKIGDLGLAATLRKSHSAHSIIGTPEFMAPELYDEEYNELVDIYAFGMCLLEMITFEYPYSECSNPAQIYKKVTSGKKPACLYKVNDPEVRQFVEKCLATVSRRLPARELLMDPFLQENGLQNCFSRLSSLGSLRYDMEEQMSFGRNPHTNVSQNGDNTTYNSRQTALPTSENWIAGHHEILKHHKVVPLPSGFEEEDLSQNVDFNVKGKKKDDDTIFLRLRIADKEGRIRSIYFPFDVEGDTAMSVASEMVAELDLADQDVTKIADIIDEEILALVPNWKAGVALDDHHPCANNIHCTTTTSENCCGTYNDRFSTVSSDSSLLEYLKSHYLVDNKCGTLPCTQVECAAIHGRFEEVTFQVDGSALSPYVAEDIPTVSSDSSDVLHHDTHDWLAEGDPSTPKSQVSHCSASAKSDDLQTFPEYSVAGNKDVASMRPLDLIEKTASTENLEEICRQGLSEGSSPVAQCGCFRSVHGSQFTLPSPSSVDPLSNGYEDFVSRELKLLAAEHQQELKELQRKHERAILEITNRWKNRKALGSSPSRNKVSPGVNAQDCKIIMNGLQDQQEEDHGRLYSPARDKKCVATKQRQSDNRRGRYSGSSPKLSAKDPVSDPKKAVMKSSPPTRPENRNLGPNRRLMKMHSFGEVDSQLYINSLSTEIGRLKNQKTSAAYRAETSDNRKHCHAGARQIPPGPRSSTRDHKQGRTR